MDRSSARLSIGQLAELTGVDTATLRSWEARYGLPAPSRTPGGQRRYGAGEVGRVRAMKRLIDAGYRTAEAARALTHEETAPSPSVRESGAAETSASADLLSALVDGDVVALRLLDERLALSSLEEVVQGLLSPLLQRIGELWARGAATVAQEHAASALVAAWLGAQTRNAPPALRPELVVTVAPQGERHEIGLLMLGACLRRQGIQVLHLGADLPVESLRSAVAARTPAVVCFGLVTSAGAEGFAEAVSVLGQIPHGPLLACGGAWKPPADMVPEVVRLSDDLQVATSELVTLTGS